MKLKNFEMIALNSVPVVSFDVKATDEQQAIFTAAMMAFAFNRRLCQSGCDEIVFNAYLMTSVAQIVAQTGDAK